MRRNRAISRLLSLLAPLALLVALLAPGPGTAQDQRRRRLTRAELRLLELESKLSFNEAGDSYHDAALIHQIVEGKGETLVERIRWIEDHSRCVSGVLTQDQANAREGNCRWTRNLHQDGRRPRGWNRALDGRWSWTRRRWVNHVPVVRRFVTGEDDYRPCEEQPDSWDGVRYGRACIERGADCPPIMQRTASRRARRPRRVLDCAVPYTRDPAAEGLHNFAVDLNPSGPS